MFHKSILSNGLRVIVAPLPGSRAMTAMLLVRVGSRYETSALQGSTHFLEHLFFKGTSRRPSTLDLSRELDSMGAEYNAYTSKDHTAYYIKAGAEHLTPSLDILSDMIFHSRFPKEEIDRERTVIIEEMHMYEDNPLMLCEELLMQAVFGKKHPLGALIIGTKHNLLTMKREKMLEYKERFYAPSNMVLVLSGKIEKNVHSTIKNYFGGYRGYKTFPAFHPFTDKKRDAILRYKDTKQIQLSVGFPSLPLLHPGLPTLTVLNTILGGNMSSRLFINIRERRGLCYFIKSEVDAFHDTGIFYVQAGLEKSRIQDAVKSIVGELKLMKQTLVTEEELQKAKQYLTGKISLEFENSLSVAGWYGRQEILTKKIQTPEQKIQQMKKVTREDIRSLAKKIFVSSRLSLALIGPYKEKRYFTSLLNI